MFCHEVSEHAAFQAVAVYAQSDQYRFVFVTLILLPWYELLLGLQQSVHSLILKCPLYLKVQGLFICFISES